MLLDHLLINAHRHISRNVVVGPSSQPLPFKESITEELLWFLDAPNKVESSDEVDNFNPVEIKPAFNDIFFMN